MRPDRRHRELDRLTAVALREAMELRPGFAGAEHFLLAIARPEQATVAARAPRTCGATYDALRHELAGAFAEIQPPPRGDSSGTIRLNPVGHQLLGCALGPAVGLGAAEPAAEHVLLAFLSRSLDPDRLSRARQIALIEQELDRMSISAATPVRRS
jgi:hypothetical protein